jgi:hypothetical protein
VPARARKEHAEFDWPPPDEELAHCFNIAAPDKEIAQGAVECAHETIDPPSLTPQPTMAIGSSTARETSAGPLEEAPGAELSGIADSTTSHIAVAKQEPAPDGTRRGDWATEILQLQALIEALTENVEWRIPNATRR